MVRLPIPSWQEIEACRTYASEFERQQVKQILRVPFVTGKQEAMVPETPATPQGTPGAPHASPLSGASRGFEEAHVDPWGLEGSGAGLPELGAKMGHSVHKYRHVKLARQAMAFWQSYDAFARQLLKQLKAA